MADQRSTQRNITEPSPHPTPWALYNLCTAPSDVNKDLGLKAKAKAKAKDVRLKAKAKAKDLGPN